jgi:hypothetical protein
MFEQLEFHPVFHGGSQALKDYGKYQLSVVLLPENQLYEAAIFDCGQFVQLPGINYGDDVIPGLTTNMVTAIMQKLKLIEIASGE